MLSRGVNYWISWSDLTFMLFIAGIAAIALSEQREVHAKSELAAARQELDALRRTSNPCAEAGQFLTGFSSCVARATGRTQLQRSGCFVTIGEDVIQFKKGEAVPIDRSAAEAVSTCLYTNALQFAASDPRAFDAITIHIDGHTDCAGNAEENQRLGAARSMSVYSRVLARAEDDLWPAATSKRAFLSRIAVRSFGQTRPEPKSQCTPAEGWAGDRRVVISVQLATERAGGGGGRS
jgi:flagellar motor protein MotB